MPAPPEYYHLAQIAMDDMALRCQVLDTEGCCRESFAWPLSGDTARQWRFKVDPLPPSPSRVLLSGSSPGERLERVRVSLEGYRPRLSVSLFDPCETRPNFWTGPEVPVDRPLDLTVAIEPGMGPGGVLARVAQGPLSSLHSESPTGYTAADWPQQWTAGDAVEVTEL